MSRNKTNKSTHPKRQYYKNNDTFTDKALTAAEKKSSQYKSTAYDRMVRDNRLDQFKKLLSTAASLGLDQTNACRYINKYMGEYFASSGYGSKSNGDGSGSGICPYTLKMMLARYPDINDAWCVHRDVVAGAAVARISQLISKSNDIDLLLKIAKAFDNSGIVHDSDAPNYMPVKKTIIQTESTLPTNVPSEKNISDETIASVGQLLENYKALDQEKDKGDSVD